MNEQQSLISQMCAITISREYGSGGGEIAARLAKCLGWQLVDHEVVVRIAQELGVSETEAEARDERGEGLIAHMLASLQLSEPSAFVGGSSVTSIDDERAYQNALRRVVTASAQTGHVVIVGRASQILLAQRRDVLHVRIVAPLEARIAYVMLREGLDRAEAQKRIQLKDRDRIRYLQAEYRRHPEDSHLYDIVVNTATLELESAVNLIMQALEYKARTLPVPTAQLGPAAGLARYPGHPGDFRPPEHLTGAQ